MPAPDDTPATLLAPYHDLRDEAVCISAEQGSRFAKTVAGDHNPLHDADAPRFCVPGDLLFALIAARYGLATCLQLTFRGMLRADTPLRFPAQPDEQFSITDLDGREYVTARRTEPIEAPAAAQRHLIEAYVACSGQTFPDLMVPLLRSHDVMFNPDRPLVVYDRMEIRLSAPPARTPRMQLSDSSLTVSGKRGDARFDYAIMDGDEAIGSCCKQMVVSGLRPYDGERMAAMVARYRTAIGG